MRSALSRTIVFCTSRYDHIQKAFIASGSFEKGVFNEGTHPNSEIWGAISEHQMDIARDRKVLVVGSTDRADFEEMLSCGTELGRVASEVNYLVPFMRYGTKERRDHPGDIVAAKNICERISDAPAPGIRKRVFFFDLHAETMEFYCDRRQIVTETLYSSNLWIDLIRKNSGSSSVFGDDIAIGSADLGRKSKVIHLADTLGVPYGLVVKERSSSSETHTLGDVIGDVRNRTVILVDDMLRGGSTAIDGAKAHLDAGANKVFLLITHPDFAGDPIGKIFNSGFFSGVICGDTYPKYTHCAHYPSFVSVVPTGHYLADLLLRKYKL